MFYSFWFLVGKGQACVDLEINQKQETRNKKLEEIVPRFSRRGLRSRSHGWSQPFRRLVAAVQTGGRSRSDGWSQPFRRLVAAVHTVERSRSDGWSRPFRRVVAAVQTGGRSRSDGCTANAEKNRDQDRNCWNSLQLGFGRDEIFHWNI